MNPMNQRYRVLVVDDSAFIRKALKRIIEMEGHFEVVGSAPDGNMALGLIEALQPDVITLDVEMPYRNGLDVLTDIRRHWSTPVVIISSMTRSGGDLAIQCLERGAFDVVSKPQSSMAMNSQEMGLDIVRKLKAAVGLVSPLAEEGDIRRSPTESKPPRPAPLSSQKIVTIGCSTGGPMALHRLLSGLPGDFPAGIVIVQHMPAGNFIQSLAERLDTVCRLKVKTAEDGDIVHDGTVYLGDIGRHVGFRADGTSYRIRLSDNAERLYHCPAVDVLFESAGSVIGPNNLSCVLTGMGTDGTNGLYTVRRNGGCIVAQSENSCVIYGMPKSAVESGLVDRVVDLEDMAETLTDLLVNAGSTGRQKH